MKVQSVRAVSDCTPKMSAIPGIKKSSAWLGVDGVDGVDGVVVAVLVLLLSL